MSTKEEEALEIIRNSKDLCKYQYNLMILSHANIYIDILNTDPVFYSLRYNPFLLLGDPTPQEELTWNILNQDGLFDFTNVEVDQYLQTVNNRVIALRGEIADVVGTTIIGELFRPELIADLNLRRAISDGTEYGSLTSSNYGINMSGVTREVVAEAVFRRETSNGTEYGSITGSDYGVNMAGVTGDLVISSSSSNS